MDKENYLYLNYVQINKNATRLQLHAVSGRFPAELWVSSTAGKGEKALFGGKENFTMPQI